MPAQRLPPLPFPAAGRYATFRVGGAVRDRLLGREPGDHDFVVVGATPEAMLALGFRPVGRDFPVFLHPQRRIDPRHHYQTLLLRQNRPYYILVTIFDGIMNYMLS